MSRNRDLAIAGGVVALAGGGWLLLRRAPAAPVAAASSSPSSIPAGAGPDLGAVSGYAGPGGGSTSGGALTAADLTSAIAAAIAQAQSSAAAGSLGTQTPTTPGTGGQVPGGAPSGSTSGMSSGNHITGPLPPVWLNNPPAGPAGSAESRFSAGSPQANALANPDQPYLIGGAASGNPNGVTMTPAQAQQWWAQWFAHPVDLAGVSPTLLPGSLVLTPDQLKQAQALQAAGNTLPKAPADYNPLGLPVVK